MLAPIPILGVIIGGWVFAILIVAAASLLAREWSLMSAPRAPVRLAVAISVSMAVVVLAAHLGYMVAAWALLAVATAACALLARASGERAEAAAFGVIYIGVPCIALAWLRDAPQGRSWTILLFAVTWAADIAAFGVGNLVGGAKLWPRFSPNKTWSGFVGGLVAAMAASVAVSIIGRMVLSAPAAALMGLVGGLATMAGDLWESILKRRFGVKDSGDLIPGHGGLLDRVDGLMFAILAVVAARLIHLAGWAA